MIKISFLSAITVYLCFSIFLVFMIWIFYNFHRNGILNETKHLQQCPYCTYLFSEYGARVEGFEEWETRRGKEEEEKGQEPVPETIQDKKDRFLICPRCRSYIKLQKTSGE